MLAKLSTKDTEFYTKFLINVPLKYSYLANTNTHSKYLRDSISACALEINLEKNNGEKWLSFKNGKTFINENLPLYFTQNEIKIPLHGIYILKSLLLTSLQTHFDFTKEAAEEIGKIVEYETIESYGLNLKKYKIFIQKYYLKLNRTVKIQSKLILKALEEANKAADIDFSYTIPALAGYGLKNLKKIYLDSGFKKFLDRNPKISFIQKFLVLHEIIETAILCEHHFKHRSYQRSHQIAQRIERAAVNASRVSWTKYQHEYMTEEINRAANLQELNLPYDFDVEPYIGYRDSAVLEIHNKIHGKNSETYKLLKLGTVREILPNVYHILFKDKIQMSKTMLRFQEHYESPKWKGQVFHLEEFKKYYINKKGKFNYYSEWAYGFNIPSYTFKEFYSGNFPKLSTNEKIILDFFRFKQKEKFYIIATAESTSESTLEHEIAHAFYYTIPAYKKEVDEVLKQLDQEKVEGESKLKKLKNLIKKHNSDYHDDVMNDEAHAWLPWSTEWLKKYGLDLENYKHAIEKLKLIYKKYEQKLKK